MIIGGGNWTFQQMPPEWLNWEKDLFCLPLEKIPQIQFQENVVIRSRWGNFGRFCPLKQNGWISSASLLWSIKKKTPTILLLVTDNKPNRMYFDKAKLSLLMPTGKPIKSQALDRLKPR